MKVCLVEFHVCIVYIGYINMCWDNQVIVVRGDLNCSAQTTPCKSWMRFQDSGDRRD